VVICLSQIERVLRKCWKATPNIHISILRMRILNIGSTATTSSARLLYLAIIEFIEIESFSTGG
jgi:hypothetical protein